MDNIIQICYFASAVLFILGLKRMSSPVTARGGIVWAGAGMLVATLITFFWPGMENYLLMTVAIMPFVLSTASMCCKNIRSPFFPVSGQNPYRNRSSNFMPSLV